jgi:hypothetical protein
MQPIMLAKSDALLVIAMTFRVDTVEDLRSSKSGDVMESHGWDVLEVDAMNLLPWYQLPYHGIPMTDSKLGRVWYRRSSKRKTL